MESSRRMENLKRNLQEMTRSKEQELSASSLRETNLLQERDDARKELDASRVENRRERTWCLRRGSIESINHTKHTRTQAPTPF